MSINHSKLILGFDGWTLGSHHYQRLVQSLKDSGYRIKLIHFGSYGHDIRQQTSEFLGPLEVCDISHYKGKSVREILLEEQPKAVVFLSTQSFLHQAVNRYCQALKIPTLHLFHGFVTVQAVETSQPNKYRFWPQSKLVSQRAFKNLTKIFPIYLKSLIETKADILSWLYFFRDVVSKIFGLFQKVASPNCSTTFCAVYGLSDVTYAHNTYRIPIHNIKVVGNPDFIKFRLSDELILSCVSPCSSKTKIIYIDDGSPTCGLTFASQNDFLNFLVKTKLKLAEQGYELLVKLHPSQAQFDTAQELIRLGVLLSTDASFTSDLLDCRAAITGPSSAAVIPASLGLTLLLAQYDQFEGQKYGIVYRDYPRSLYLRNLMELKRLLNQETKPDVNRMKMWVQQYLYPLPAEDMPKRVVEIIDQMVHKHERPCAE
ncbi:hypothetical protein B7O87_09270 [Cylindrospermopsis raciborskii CENA303]|uniref:Uncharacterized protein n=1 Tax=Cylindrospermopsis raciborskii CENA303 TaxID=1170769 RepID=A0A1X4G6H8_9CYAN|nr:hypothetical protein [Cylindrospermopsis raciborskii]OSO90600.1 hypothetical protein B7O87_09270 [Cylindrospermopsis raciborskii CENA303]